ncbi:doublecortin domain-containing protein 2-like isoform X1 [Manis javanica]|uniref:doublecortin domain-containing protein 2-like isoform X1 n=1 Tax=Manis javanica TaxID=9974 RepID=UPI003C6CCAE3
MSGARARPSLQAQPAVNGVLVYRNGNPFFAGRRVVLREKGCSFDALLREATRGVRAPFGPVRNLYTPRAGHRVRRLEQVQSGASQLRGWGPGGLQEAQLLGHRRNQEKTNGSQFRACAYKIGLKVMQRHHNLKITSDLKMELQASQGTKQYVTCMQLQISPQFVTFNILISFLMIDYN